ncbi:MAG: hypothetical protein QM765_26205 [Myxococcales bacterium]
MSPFFISQLKTTFSSALQRVLGLGGSPATAEVGTTTARSTARDESQTTATVCMGPP